MGKYAAFRMPETIHYGYNTFEKVGEEAALKGKKALIISDQVMDDLGYVSRCQSYLLSAEVKSVVYLGVETEPVDTYVEEALRIFQEEKCDVLISLGGGSCIDVAKAVAILVTNGGSIADYMNRKTIVSVSPVPHISIPTTAGTGSEATDVTVITHTASNVKMMIKQPPLMPDVAIVDSFLTHSSPQSVTAATGIDALSHAIEAYISKLAQPMTNLMALSSMELIVNNIKRAYTTSDDVQARQAMSLGSLQAGIAFSNASVCLVHGMSRPIGALFNVPHGFSNAMLLPVALEFSKDSCVERLADLGRIFDPAATKLTDDEAAEIAVTSVKNLCLELNIPNLQQWGIDQKAFQQAIPKMAEDALLSGSPANNPRVPSQKEIEHLYDICYDFDFSAKVSQVNLN